MKKEEVEIIVKALMKKLHMTRELEDIMRCYMADGFTIPFFKNSNGFLMFFLVRLQ